MVSMFCASPAPSKRYIYPLCNAKSAFGVFQMGFSHDHKNNKRNRGMALILFGVGLPHHYDSFCLETVISAISVESPTPTESAAAYNSKPVFSNIPFVRDAEPNILLVPLFRILIH